MIEYNVQVRGLTELQSSLAAVPELVRAESLTAMRNAALVAEAEIKRQAPVKTSRLRSSIHSEVVGSGDNLEGRISTAVSYAAAVELGSAPHEIAATNAMALSIPLASGGGFGGGRLSGQRRSGQDAAFFRRVHHPGSKGRYFMRDGMRMATPAIREVVALLAKRVLAGIKGI